MYSSRLLFLLLVSLLLAAGCIAERPGDDDDAAATTDSDGDGVVDSEDACPEDDQQWSDVDGDGVCDEIDDACPASADQWTDADGDGVCDEEDDACPDDPTGWTDADGDGHCEEADDACPGDPLQWSDADGDGYCDEVDDLCPGDGTGWTDGDGDGYCDEAADACPEDPLQWSDADGDGFCDEVDDDCPGNPEGWVDSNNDGVCDGEDDTDGDGISDGEEAIYGDDCAISDRLMADTDADGYGDNQDLYPRDPYPEYVLFRNDSGTIDLVLSNRDGTFQAPVSIGLPYGDTGLPAYRYLNFVISDFDNNGMTDFLALGDSDPSDPANPYDLWWFGRVAGPSSFTQRLLDNNLAKNILHTLADLNNDERVDLAFLSRAPPSPSTVESAEIHSFLNQGTIATAECAWSEDPLNPEGCAFVRVLAIDLGGWVRPPGPWVVRQSRDAVDVNGDGNRDLVILKIDNGGNVPVPVTLLHGTGTGTFTLGSINMFVHNEHRSSSPANSIIFNDFDNDGLGDLILGLDDDGDAGSAWFYPGRFSTTVGFQFDVPAAFEAFDINTAHETGSDNPGATASARSFDFDFDGNQDVMLGYNYQRPSSPPSKTVLLAGLGTGLFAAPQVVRDFPGLGGISFAQHFAIPQRLCQRFSISP